MSLLTAIRLKMLDFDWLRPFLRHSLSLHLSVSVYICVHSKYVLEFILISWIILLDNNSSGVKLVRASFFQRCFWLYCTVCICLVSLGLTLEELLYYLIILRREEQ